MSDSKTLNNTDYYIDTTKINRITEGINKWRDSVGKGTFVYPARFGKTLSGIMLLRRMFVKNKELKVIIGTKNSISKEQWTKQINFEFPHSNIEVCTYNQIVVNKNFRLQYYDLFIADEIHNLFSIEFIKILKQQFFSYKYILGLTATPPSNKEYNILCPTVDYIEVQEAIDNDWIVNYKEINVALQLSSTDKERYYEFSKIMKTMFGSNDSLFKGMVSRIPGINSKFLFKDDYDVLISCYSGKKTFDVFGKSLYIPAYQCREAVAKAMGWDVNLNLNIEYNRERDLYWNPSAIEENVRNYVEIQRRRNEIICSNPIKRDAIVAIYNKYKLPCICFNDNIMFAESVSKLIDNSFCYHSKLSKVNLIDYTTGNYYTNKKDGTIKSFGLKRIRDYLISNFKTGNIKFISTVEALDESLDVQNISLVITSTGSVNPIQYKQRVSRANTKDINNENKEAIIINLYFDDFVINDYEVVKSRDKTKLILRQKDSYNVEWLTLDELLS